MAERKSLSDAIKLMMGLSIIASLPHYSYAEEEAAEDDEIEEVFVTGSRIAKSDYTSTSPITVVTSEQLEASGLTTVEDYLQNLPAVNGGDLGSTVNNGNAGFATASLRGLGGGRTLILINGRRPATNDLNMIPLSYIKSVEVLRDGASTTYGSDAIAGVINFITKDDFEGIKLEYQADISGESDGRITKFSATFGGNFDTGNAVMALEYTDRDVIWQRDRDFSKCPIFESGGTPFCGGSGTTYPAHIFPASGGSTIFKDGVYRNFNSQTDSYNYAASSYMVTPQEVFSVSGNAYSDMITEGFTTLTAFAELGYSNRISDQLLAPVGTFWAPSVPASHPNNPAGETVFIARRLAETGGRNFTQDADSWRMVFGLEGELDNGWTWDVSYNYGRFVDARLVEGQANQPRFEMMLDPDACSADADCLAATGDVGYWNPFATDSLTEDMQDYALVTHSPIIRGDIRFAQVNIAGDFGGFELPAGEPLWAIGYETRYEDYLSQPDGAALLGQIYFVSGEKTEGEFTVQEIYAELAIPLLADMPGAENLDLEFGIRSSDYDYVDDAALNTKIALNWSPIPDITVRTTSATGFRAPSITELFQPQSQSAQQYSDPCVNYGELDTSVAANANIVANCQTDGLAADFELTSNQAGALFGGNPDLEPEESESLTFGVVVTPEALDGFSASIDYFSIKIEGGIGTAGTDNVITQCYSSPNFSSPLCALIVGPSLTGDSPLSGPGGARRDALGVVSGVQLTNANLSEFTTSGVDFSFEYTLDVGPGSLLTALTGTYLLQYDYTPFAGADKVEAAGFVAEDQWVGNPAAFAEIRTALDLNYSMDEWRFNYNTTFQSETEDFAGTDANADNIAESIFYHNFQVAYDLDEYSFAAGIRNLTDEEPPYITNYDDMNTINQSYDTAGRYFYGRVTAKF